MSTHGSTHVRAKPDERLNQEMKKGLAVRLQGRPHSVNATPACLPTVLRDLHTRKSEGTGYTPSEALLGYILPQLGDQDLRAADDANQQAPDHPDRQQCPKTLIANIDLAINVLIAL